jgi:microcystin degradation protein MlrC
VGAPAVLDLLNRNRILIGSLYHESNGLSPIIAGEDDFVVARGDELFDACGTRSALAGVVDGLRQTGAYELVPTVFARAVPNGVVSLTLYEELKNEVLAVAERERDRLVGVVLALHGSMFIEEIGDAEGDLLTSLRELLPELPIVSALDTHATLSQAMIDNLDAMVGYKEAPHTDTYETGLHAARIAHAQIQGAVRPTVAAVPVPMIIAGEQSETTTEPMRFLMNACRELEEQSGVLAASFLLGFPWTDDPDNRVNAVVVTDRDQELAQSLANQLAAAFWERRYAFEFCMEAHPMAEAIDAALSKSAFPVYLSDSGDNPTAGATADNVELLRMLLAHPGVAALPKPALYGGIYDPNAAASCRGRVGETVSLELGGNWCPYCEGPVSVTGKVLAEVRDWETYRSDLVLLGVGNLEIIIAAKHVGFVDPEIFRALGAEPAERQLVVVKLGYLTAPHKQVAGDSVLALSPGCTNELLETIPYQHLCRPCWPLDKW